MKREDIKAAVPGITDEQLDKIMNLHGEDITAQKNTITTLTADRDGLKTQLDTANAKLTGYDPEWKTKADDAAKQADSKIAEMRAGYAADHAVGGLKFSSESAKKAFVADLKAKNPPVQEDGSLLGFADFATGYKKTDPSAFLSDEKPPVITAGAPGTPTAPTTNAAANTAFRSLLGKE